MEERVLKEKKMNRYVYVIIILLDNFVRLMLAVLLHLVKMTLIVFIIFIQENTFVFANQAIMEHFVKNINNQKAMPIIHYVKLNSFFYSFFSVKLKYS
jgi:hypothetical protein